MRNDNLVAQVLNNELVLGEFHFRPGELKKHGVSLGITRDTKFTGITKTLTDDQRETTVYIRGITGSGKSRLLQAMIAQDIARGHALCLVDPTGSIYRPTAELIALADERISSLAEIGIPAHDRKIKEDQQAFRSRFDFLDFARPHNYRFNPLYVDRDRGETAPEIAGDFMKTVSRLFGDLNETRRLKIILESACQLLAEAGGTLLDVPTLLKMDEKEIKEFVGKLDRKAQEEGWEIKSELARWYMEEFFTAMRPSMRIERMESTINALGVWLSDPMVRKFVDCRKGNLDFYQILNEGRVLLCHIPLGANTDSTRVLGGLIVNKIQRQVYRRKPEQRKLPVSLYVDEFHLFVDEEFAVATATVRQFGLRLLLAHQSAEQPPLNTEEGQGILKTIMANSGTKIFFRLGVEDAEQVERELFLYGVEHRDAKAGQFEGGHQVKRKFTDITRTIQESRGVTTSRSIARALSEGITKSKSVTHTVAEGLSFTFTEGEGVSRSEVHSHGVTVTHGKGKTKTVSNATGVTITQGENETHVEARGEAHGTSKSSGRSTSAGTSEGASIVHGENEGTSYSTNAGSSHSQNMADFDINTGRMAHSESGGSSRSRSANNAVANMNSSFQSNAQSFSEAVSDIISASSALSKGTSNSRSTSQTRTTGVALSETEAKSLSEQLAEGVSKINSISRALGESLTKSVSMMKGETESRSKTETESDGYAETKSKSTGTSAREVIEYYTLEEERALNAQILYTLPPRQAWIVTPPDYELEDDQFGETGIINAVEFKTHNIRGSFDEEVENPNPGGEPSTLLMEFLKVIQPKPSERAKNSVFETAGMKIKETFSSREEDIEGFN